MLVNHYIFGEIAEFSIINKLNPHKQLLDAIADSATHESRHNDFRYNWRCKLDPLGGPPPQKNYIGGTKNVRNLIHYRSPPFFLSFLG